MLTETKVAKKHLENLKAASLYFSELKRETEDEIEEAEEDNEPEVDDDDVDNLDELVNSIDEAVERYEETFPE